MNKRVLIVFTLVLVCCFHLGESRRKKKKPASNSCEDTVSKSSFIRIQGKKGKLAKVTSCQRLVECYPGQCPSYAGNGGRCCKSCRALGDLKCMDQLTRCNPMDLEVNGKTVNVKSCEELINRYPELCAQNQRLKSQICCKSCKNVKQDLVRCSPKGIKTNCFCYPQGQCDGKKVIPCPNASKKACKKAGTDYQCCCQKEFWHPFCRYKSGKGKGGADDDDDDDDDDEGTVYGTEVDPFDTDEDLPFDADAFNNWQPKSKNKF